MQLSLHFGFIRNMQHPGFGFSTSGGSSGGERKCGVRVKRSRVRVACYVVRFHVAGSRFRVSEFGFNVPSIRTSGVSKRGFGFRVPCTGFGVPS